MKRLSWLVAAAAAVVIAVPAWAGSGGKCSAEAQACLNHMAAKYQNQAWVGVELDKAEDGTISVRKVMSDSPAATAGMKAGDVLVALNGASMADEEAVKKARGEWAVGQTVTYTVLRDGAKKEVAVTLSAMPELVFASYVGGHMLENHAVVATAQEHGHDHDHATKAAAGGK